MNKKDWKCNPFVFINIGPDGEVRSCGSAFGNIKALSLEECLNTRQASKARRFMKTCQKPCLQTCWAHPQSDSLKDIIDNFILNVRESNLDRENEGKTIKKAFEMLVRYENILRERNAQSK